MQHDEWAAKLKRLLQSAETTASDWDDLLSETESARRTSVGDWHIQQTAGNYADFLREKDQSDAATSLEERIADDAESNIMYWHSAAGTSLAQAALDHFASGNHDKAVPLAKRAISHLGHTANPDSIYETLISELRSHFQSST